MTKTFRQALNELFPVGTQWSGSEPLDSSEEGIVDALNSIVFNSESKPEYPSVADIRSKMNETPKPPPNWKQFTRDLWGLPGFVLAFKDHPANAQISSRIGNLGDGSKWEGANDLLLTFWNSLVPPSLIPLSADINAIAARNSIPLTMDANTGMISVT